MNKKKLFIVLKCIIFMLIFGYIFTHVSYIFRPALAHTHKNISGYYAEPRNSMDVVFVGTSGTFSAFAPMNAWIKYGITSYNFCINAIGADVLPYAVIEAMKTQKPKVLVVDCYTFIHKQIASQYPDEDIVRYSTDGFKYSLNRFNLINSVVPKGMNKLPFYFDIIKYHSTKPEWDFLYSRHNVDKGYQFLPWAVTTRTPLTNKETKLSAELDMYLENLLKTCKKQKTEVLFVYYPYGYISEEASGNVNYIAHRVKDYGFKFLNCEEYQDEMALDYNRDYWDVRHFNIYGAEKITDFMAKYLVKNYNLTDKRNDKRFSRWNSDYKIWQEEVKAGKTEIDTLISDSKK